MVGYISLHATNSGSSTVWSPLKPWRPHRHTYTHPAPSTAGGSGAILGSARYAQYLILMPSHWITSWLRTVKKGPGQSKTNDSLKREREKKIGWERGKQVRFVIFLIQCQQCSWNWLPKSLHSADSSVWGGSVQKGKVIQIVSPSDSCWSSLISSWLSSFTKQYTEEQKPNTSPHLHDCKLCRGPWHHLEWPA